MLFVAFEMVLHLFYFAYVPKTGIRFLKGYCHILESFWYFIIQDTFYYSGYVFRQGDFKIHGSKSNRIYSFMYCLSCN